MIPTTPWEVPFRAIARWLGIESSGIDEVCPNLHNFDSISLTEPDMIFNEILSIPTFSPTSTTAPSALPSTRPSGLEDSKESASPTMIPSLSPSYSDVESADPSIYISSIPTIMHSFEPTEQISSNPTRLESYNPTDKLSNAPSLSPSMSIIQSEEPSSASTTLENVALNQPTKQSSDAFHPSGNAVDGDLSTFSRTARQKNPHWTLNLDRVYKIKTIRLHLDAKKLKKHKKIRMQILNGKSKVWDYRYPGTPTSTVEVNPPENASTGNKVKIILIGKNKQLILREVEVIAAPN